MRRFNKNKDLELLNKWISIHGENTVAAEDLPDVGYITEHSAGFLIQTDSGFAMIEFVVSNPHSNSQDRHDGLNDVVWALMSAAKGRGYKKIFSTVKSSMRERARSYGFNEIGKASVMAVML